MPTVVDLFCGAGGLSSALERAGWTSVAAVDVDPDCIATLNAAKRAVIDIPSTPGRAYLQDANVICADVRDLSGKNLRPTTAPKAWRPDLLSGGPPCQPFSSAGRMGALKDPRGQLFSEFVRLANELRPRFVLFENVRGLLTAKGPDGRSGSVLELIQRSFEDIGYACRFALLNAADFGAAQRRVRLFMLASCDEELPQFPVPTHGKEPTFDLLSEVLAWVPLREFLKGRPEPDASEVVSPSGARANALRRLRPGTGLRSEGIVEANRPSGHWGYRQDCFLADLDAPARTIRAASTPDWIRVGGKLRRLTWRECAALQGFDEAWPFQGSVASRFRQIGNAVQGNIGEALGISLLGAAARHSKVRPMSAPWPPEFHRRTRYTDMEERVNGRHRRIATGGRG